MLCERHRKERRQDRLPEAYFLGVDYYYKITITPY